MLFEAAHLVTDAGEELARNATNDAGIVPNVCMPQPTGDHATCGEGRGMVNGIGVGGTLNNDGRNNGAETEPEMQGDESSVDDAQRPAAPEPHTNSKTQRLRASGF